MSDLQNPEPKIFEQRNVLSEDILYQRQLKEQDPDIVDEFDNYEIYELLRHIRDPEHPLTLEQLNIVQVEDVFVDDKNSKIEIEFTPTIPHCSLAQTIGLTMKVKLLRSLPKRFKVRVRVKQGTHSQETQINKQLQDKERIQAAMENLSLVNIVNSGIIGSDRLN